MGKSGADQCFCRDAEGHLALDTRAALYYTLDGSLPTTNSLHYTAPFMLANNATVSANAFEPGFNPSVAANAAFTIIPNVLYAAPGSLSNGVFRVELSGVAGKSYIFQASTDMKTWVSLSANIISGVRSFSKIRARAISHTASTAPFSNHKCFFKSLNGQRRHCVSIGRMWQQC